MSSFKIYSSKDNNAKNLGKRNILNFKFILILLPLVGLYRINTDCNWVFFDFDQQFETNRNNQFLRKWYNKKNRRFFRKLGF